MEIINKNSKVPNMQNSYNSTKVNNSKPNILLPRLSLILSGIFIVLIVVILVLITLSKNNVITNPVPSSTPSSSITSQPSDTNLATSSAAQTDMFRELDNNLNQLKIDCYNLDLNESQLSYPILDTNFNYQKNK
jgi:hypothetical protein